MCLENSNMKCVRCQVLLDAQNWLPSRQRRNQHICTNCVKLDNNQRYQNRKKKYLLSYKLNRLVIKNKVFSHYGGQCQICKEKDVNKLSLDHVNGNGRQHRKQILKVDSGSQFYKWVWNHKPNNIRLLCFNCNCQIDMIKKILIETYQVGCKYCGNNTYRSNCCRSCFQICKRNKYIDLKLQVFNHYGMQCARCGEKEIQYLTIDHIDNSGSQHRKQIGTQIFPWLKRNNYPNNFQILCFNCNYSKATSS